MIWSEKRLDEVCKLITDGKHGDCKNEFESGYFFISAKDILDWNINYENARQITKQDFVETHRRTQLEPFDIVMVSTGASIGRLAIVKDNEFTKRTTFQKSVAILKPKHNILNHNYLAYFLKNSNALIHSTSSGSAQKNVLLKDLRAFKIPLCSMKTQKRIADILSSYDDLIENNLKRIKLLEQAAQNIYKEWFVNMRFPGHENTPINPETGLPEGWKKTSVTHYFDFIRGIEVGSKNYVKKQSANTIPFIRVGSLGSRDTDIFTNISLVKDKILSFSDVCISMDGSIGLVGYGLMGAYSTGIRKVSPKIEKYGNGFIFCLLKSQDIQDTIKAYAKGSTILHASSSIIHMTFNDSPIKISNQFNDIVEPMYNKMLNLLKQNYQLKSARDILLPRLMNQTIEV